MLAFFENNRAFENNASILGGICGGGEFSDNILQKCGFTQTHTHTG